MGANAAIYCHTFYNDGTASASMTMDSPSMLVVEDYYDVYRNVTGPADGGAIIVANTIQRSNGVWEGSYTITGNVIFDLPASAYDENTYPFLETFITKGGSTASICLPGQANFVMEPSDCSGAGYEGDGGDPDPVDPQVLSYSYAFEDLYPEMGDYDFNDIVLDIATTYNRANNNAIESVEIEITLATVGATKQIGAGLRLMGVAQSDIASITFVDPNNMRSTLSGSLFDASTYESGTTSAAVIPLFGDAHKVYNDQYDYQRRLILNTAAANAITPYTMKIVLVMADQSKTNPMISMENMDFFIGFAGALNKRTEVHLFEWIANATPNGEVYADGAAEVAIGGRYTWAVCVPGIFTYPKEGVTITEAYPDFTGWAANRTTNQEWYTNPEQDLVYTRK
ncbi:MAG: LruC domain-containing protein [Bacteroides sp.]|nr:LruC domain-containing protein [Bacteroides sp.]